MRASPIWLAMVLVGCGGTAPIAPGSSTSASGGLAATGDTSGAGASSGASASSGTSGLGGDTRSSSTGASASSASSGSTGAASSGTTGAASTTGTTGAAGTTGTTGAITSALLRPANPMACADPAVISTADAGQTFYVYCTGMSHVWKTTDWTHFSNVRSTTTFDLTGMTANGKHIGSWWAPGIVYAPGAAQYVMWVSVPDALATNGSSGWDTRSLAVLTSPGPAGPWTYQGIGVKAQAAGQHFIDPFLFRDHDGGHYVYFKQYGGGVASRIMGAHVNASWEGLTSAARVDIMNGYGGAGTWEDNVRENPAVWYDPATGHHHLLFSGGHWRDDTYATGHAVSACGPLCTGSGGWHITNSGDRGVVQVVQAKNDANFSSGGPGGAVFQDDSAHQIIYAAAARSASGTATRYLMRDAIKWKSDAPYVDTAHHRPEGL